MWAFELERDDAGAAQEARGPDFSFDVGVEEAAQRLNGHPVDQLSPQNGRPEKRRESEAAATGGRLHYFRLNGRHPSQSKSILTLTS